MRAVCVGNCATVRLLITAREGMAIMSDTALMQKMKNLAKATSQVEHEQEPGHAQLRIVHSLRDQICKNDLPHDRLAMLIGVFD